MCVCRDGLVCLMHQPIQLSEFPFDGACAGVCVRYLDGIVQNVLLDEESTLVRSLLIRIFELIFKFCNIQVRINHKPAPVLMFRRAIA